MSRYFNYSEKLSACEFVLLVSVIMHFSYMLLKLQYHETGQQMSKQQQLAAYNCLILNFVKKYVPVTRSPLLVMNLTTWTYPAFDYVRYKDHTLMHQYTNFKIINEAIQSFTFMKGNYLFPALLIPLTFKNTKIKTHLSSVKTKQSENFDKTTISIMGSINKQALVPWMSDLIICWKKVQIQCIITQNQWLHKISWSK